LSINLYELIRAHNFQGFSLPLIRRFSRQMVACLLLLQQKHIIHCDLKPENILLCEARKADVRVIDFGSSCREEEKVYTYIQSRFYRSPEVILGSSYGLGIDMWSFGCILAELWTGYPIFPGENEQEQLACIMEIFGPPDRHLVEKCTRKKLFFDSVGKPRVTVSSKGRRRRPSSKTLQQALKTEDEAFIDFISRCLRWDPDRRLKPNDAVNHPFITNMPLNQRPSIPDEARRAARVRSAATGSTSTPTVPSPVKRAANQGNAFAQQQVQQTTSTVRSGTGSTPQSSIRNNPPLTTSPSKPMFAGPGRRQVSVTSANTAGVAGSKRTSNGLVLGSQASMSGLPTMQQPMPAASRQPNPSLAQLAARESMANMNSAATNSGGATSGLGSARWRS
jgi:dual specificity tyrosine-phosphorylation-regulated kinase 2/3/4